MKASRPFLELLEFQEFFYGVGRLIFENIFKGHMDIKEAIAELRGTGYTVSLEPGNTVKLSWQGQGLPDKARVLPLVEYLRSHKAETLDLLTREATPGQSVPHDILGAIFQEVLGDLNRRTLDGLLGEVAPSKLSCAQEAQARVDQVWRGCLEGKATLDLFRQAVKDWHGAVIALFLNASPQGQGLKQEKLL